MITVTVDGMDDYVAGLGRVADGIGVRSGGLASLVELAGLQLLRFTFHDIEVDSGRTQGSLFFRHGGIQGNSAVSAYLGTNVTYAPYVRDAAHTVQFFKNAEETEGPAVAAAFGVNVETVVNNAFD